MFVTGILVILFLGMGGGLLWQIFIAPKRWMKQNSSGLWNPYVKFNRQHLRIQPVEVLGYKQLKQPE